MGPGIDVGFGMEICEALRFWFPWESGVRDTALNIFIGF